MKLKYGMRVLSILVLMALALGACSPATPTATQAVVQPTEAMPEPTEAMPEPTEAMPEPTEDMSAEPITLKIWVISQSPEGIALGEARANQFTETHPNVTIEYSAFSFDDMNRSLRLALDGGTGPDVAHASSGAIGTDAYALAGHLVDLTQVAQERGWVENYGQDLLDFANAGTPGQVFGVPTGASTVGVYYNPEIFAQYNLEVPETFDEFEAILATLKENGVTPISVGALDQWPLGHVWEQLLHANTDFDLLTRLYTLDPTATYEDPAIVAATAKLQEWADLGYFQDNFLATNFADANTLFITGQSAMNIGGTWVAADFTAQPEFEAHFFPLPRMNPAIPWHTGGQAPDNNWVVSTYSAHQAAAIDFVDFILSQEVALADWNQGNIVNYRFAEVPEPTTVLQGDIYRAMQATGPGYYMAVTGELLASSGAIVQQVAAGDLTPEEAMAEMQTVYLQGANASNN